jgi:hypothetical protein
MIIVAESRRASFGMNRSTMSSCSGWRACLTTNSFLSEILGLHILLSAITRPYTYMLLGTLNSPFVVEGARTVCERRDAVNKGHD